MPDRETALVALASRLSRAAAAQDPSLLLARDAAAAAHDVRAATDPATDRPAAHTLGWYHWYRYRALPEGQDQEDLRAALAYFTYLYPQEPDSLSTGTRRCP